MVDIDMPLLNQDEWTEIFNILGIRRAWLEEHGFLERAEKLSEIQKKINIDGRAT